MNDTPQHEIVAAVAGVAGVASVTADLSGDGGSGQLRVVFAPGYQRAQVARRIAELLDRRFGLQMDPLAVARLADQDPTTAGAEDGAGATPERARLAEVEEPEVETPRVEEPAAEEPAAEEPAAEAPADEESAPGEPTVPDQPAAPEPTPGPVTAPTPVATVITRRRPIIRRLELTGGGLEVRAHVVLAVGAREATGEASGAATHHSRLRTVGRATLAAVERFLGDRAKLELEALEITASGSDPRVVVEVVLLTHEEAERLVGATFARSGDEEHAVMRATLDAINRRVEGILATDPPRS